MPADATHTVTTFVCAGPFPVAVLAAAGVALALLVAALVWFETRPRWRLLAAVLPLRLAALAVVLYMLAEPTIQTEVRRTRSPAMCVMVDGSASMDVADELPEGDPPAEAVRWAAPQAAPALAETLAHLDGAVAALAAADQALPQIAALAHDPRPTPQAVERAARIERLVRAAARRLAAADDANTDRAAEPEAPSADRGGLMSDVLDQVRTLRRRVAASSEGDRASLAGHVESLRRALAAPAARAQRRADALAADYARHADAAAIDRLHTLMKRSRRQQTGELLTAAQHDWLGRLEKQARVWRYRFDGDVVALPAGDPGSSGVDEAAPGAKATDLVKALRQAAREAATGPLEAVVLLTDGRHNAGGDPLEAASTSPPLYIVPVGRSEPLRDVVLHHAQAPRTVFRNDRIVFEAMVDAFGADGETLDVDLLEGGQVVETHRVRVAGDAYVGRISLTHRADEPGARAFRVRVRPVPGEKVPDNNEAGLAVEVVEGTLRTLLVDRLPRWEFRYLRNLLKRDPHVEYQEILLGGDGGGDRPALPGSLEEWSRFGVVILGDIGPADLTPDRQEALERFVQDRGGTLVVIAGDDAMPAAFAGMTLERLLPVGPSETPAVGPRGCELVLTPEGRSVPALQLSDDPPTDERLWREQVTVHRISDVARPKPTAHVLIGAVPRANGPGGGDPMQAFLCWHYDGRGRVVYLAAPVTYQLRQRYGDRYHHRFWGQLLRWSLARELGDGSRTCRLGTDKGVYTQGDPVRVSLRLSGLQGEPVGGARPTLIARRGDRNLARVEMTEDPQAPGEYGAALEHLPTGEVTLEAGGAAVQDLLAREGAGEPVRCSIRIEPDASVELRDTRCNLALLRQLAAATGGLLLPPTALQAAVEQLDLKPQMTRSVIAQPRWARFRYLWLFVGCLAAEWMLRRRAGLA